MHIGELQAKENTGFTAQPRNAYLTTTIAWSAILAVFNILNNTDWDSYDALAGGTILRHSGRSLLYVSDTGFKITLHGTGFTYDALGIPTGGTITGLDVVRNGVPLAQYTGLSTPLTDFATLGLGLTSGVPGTTSPDMPALFAVLRDGDDLINANDLSKSISGYDGNDTIFANGGDDWMSGGRGVDSYFGGTGLNGVFFDDGEPLDHGVKVNFSLTTGNIVDDGYGNTETATDVQMAEGTAFADRFIGGAGGNGFYGQAGNDTLIGGDGNDSLQGGDGLDAFFGGNGIDRITFYDVPGGGAGVKVNLTNPSATQILNDGFGNTERASEIENVVGSLGNDTLTGSATANILWGSDGNDILTGNGGRDSLYGEAGNDRIYGGADDDILMGDKGRDQFDGGSGNDDLGFWEVDATGHGVTVNLSRSSRQVIDDGYGNVETATNIEWLEGSDFRDRFTGNALSNALWGYGGGDTLTGGDGNDDLYGGDGNDQIFGDNGTDFIVAGSGNDLLTGGADNDYFNFLGLTPGADGVDTITDFSSLDGIQVNVHWAPDLPLGQITVGNFRSGMGVTTALSAEQHFIYDTLNRKLYFDADGSGVQAATLIASLTNASDLSWFQIFTIEPF